VTDFKNILVAVDVSNEAEFVMRKAKYIAERFDSNLTIIHVVEPVVLDYTVDLVPSFNADIEESLIERANLFVKQSMENLNLNGAECKVLVGSTKHEIHREAREANMDLIVIGTHGRHGLSLLLGATASAVLHGTPCDVLTVKIS